MSAPSQFKT